MEILLRSLSVRGYSQQVKEPDWSSKLCGGVIAISFTFTVFYALLYVLHWLFRHSRDEETRRKIPERPIQMARDRSFRAVMLGFTVLLTPFILRLIFPKEINWTELLQEWAMEMLIVVGWFIMLDLGFRLGLL